MRRETGFSSARRAAALGGAALALLGGRPARADVTADLILSLRAGRVDRGASTRLDNARLLADATLRLPLRLHLDLNRDAPEPAEIYEAYVEWGALTRRGRFGRFQVPFGIHNRSELYYVGLFHDPLIKNYPAGGPHLIDSASGVEYLGGRGPWQIEGALFNHQGPGRLLPSGDEGAVRVQWFGGSLILGASALRERGLPGAAGRGADARFLGLDWRVSRPGWIVRGEWVAGWVAGAAPGGFYLDLLYHSAALPRVTLVGRVEGVHGARGGGSGQQQTLGLKWEFLPGTALAINQGFGSARPAGGALGTTLFVWYVHRL